MKYSNTWEEPSKLLSTQQNVSVFLYASSKLMTVHGFGYLAMSQSK